MRSRIIVITLSLLFVGAFSVIITLHSSTPHFNNSVTGQLLITGGPAPGTARPSDGEVTARVVGGGSYSTSVPSSGKFILQLPVGSYILSGASPQFGNGHYHCFAPRTVTILKDKAIQQDVFCSEK
jgi:hypothetical protein